MKAIKSENRLGGLSLLAVLAMIFEVCPVQGQLTLPYYGVTSTSGKAFWVSNSYSGAGDSYGGFFYSAGQTGRGVFGQADGINGFGVKGWAKNSGDVVNYGGHFCATGMRGIGVYGWAENTGDVENFGGYIIAQGLRGIGMYAKGGPNGCAGQFEGDIQIIGGGNGIVFPDGTKQTTAATGGGTGNTTCFPQPAYDSGWISTPSGSPGGLPYTTTLTHGLGGKTDDYVVDIQLQVWGIVPTGPTNRGIGDTFYYSNLTTSTISVSAPYGALDYLPRVRVRIWTSNCAGGTGPEPK